MFKYSILPAAEFNNIINDFIVTIIVATRFVFHES